MGPLPAPDRIWIREDRYGIDLEGAYGVKPKDIDAVEYVRADLARSAPEPAPGEGSPSPSEIEDFQADLWAALLNTSAKITPSHTWEKWMKIKRAIPSGPSQDSQEVAKAIDLRTTIEVKKADALGRGEGESLCCPIQFRAGQVDAYEQVLALLSQSPKGAAGAELERARKACTRYKGDLETVIRELENDLAIAEGEAAGGDRPSAPKTGLRGAGAPGDETDFIRRAHEQITLAAFSEDGADGGECLKWMREAEAKYPFLVPQEIPEDSLLTEPAPGDVGEAGGGQP